MEAFNHACMSLPPRRDANFTINLTVNRVVQRVRRMGDRVEFSEGSDSNDRDPDTDSKC